MTEPLRIRRPMLPPSLARLWRATDRLQLGLTRPTPVILRGLDERDAQFVLGLDGRHDLAGVLGQASALGLTASRAEQLLELLDSADCLADGTTDSRVLAELDLPDRERLGPDVASLALLPPAHDLGLTAFSLRRAAHVEVHGAGRVGAAILSLLAASGVGAISCVDEAAVRPGDVSPLGPSRASVGRPRSDAAMASAMLTSPGVTTESVQPPDVVVLAGAPIVDPAVSDDLVNRAIPHLPVTLVETTATVGPLLVPGDGPCLRCIDLYRTDRDPDWPLVAAQLGSGCGAPVEACDVVLSVAAASLAVLEVVAWLERSVSPHRWQRSAGRAYVLRLPGGQPRPRTYSAHPRCGCSWLGAP